MNGNNLGPLAERAHESTRACSSVGSSQSKPVGDSKDLVLALGRRNVGRGRLYPCTGFLHCSAERGQLRRFQNFHRSPNALRSNTYKASRCHVSSVDARGDGHLS